jgi:hypothetical protein
MQYHMAGQAEDALSTALATTFAKALEKSVIGATGSAQRASNADFYAEVLAKTGQKFLDSPTGTKTVNKLVFVGMVPAFVLGVLAGYLWYKRKA